MAGIFLGQEAARGQISDELAKIFGSQMSKSLEQMIQAANRNGGVDNITCVLARLEAL